jgi:hypothetical protein
VFPHMAWHAPSYWELEQIIFLMAVIWSAGFTISQIFYNYTNF